MRWLVELAKVRRTTANYCQYDLWEFFKGSDFFSNYLLALKTCSDRNTCHHERTSIGGVPVEGGIRRSPSLDRKYAIPPSLIASILDQARACSDDDLDPPPTEVVPPTEVEDDDEKKTAGDEETEVQFAQMSIDDQPPPTTPRPSTPSTVQATTPSTPSTPAKSTPAEVFARDTMTCRANILRVAQASKDFSKEECECIAQEAVTIHDLSEASISDLQQPRGN